MQKPRKKSCFNCAWRSQKSHKIDAISDDKHNTVFTCCCTFSWRYKRIVLEGMSCSNFEAMTGSEEYIAHECQ